MAKFETIYSYNQDFIHNTNSEDYWYIAGLLAADGYISDAEIELCLATRDKGIIKKTRDIMCPDKPLYKRKNAGTGAYMLKLNNVAMVQHFKELFSMTSNQKGEELRFPNVPGKYLKDFVRGYFDGDGSVGLTKGYQVVQGVRKTYHGLRVRILGNKEFLSVMLDEVRKQVPNNTRKLSHRKAYNVYEITYNFSTAQRFLEWLYVENPHMYLDRKHSRYMEIQKQLEEIV